MNKQGWLAVLGGFLLSAGTAAADDGPMPLRSFDRYEFDSTSVQGVWGELLGEYVESDDGGVEADQLTVAGRLALGAEKGEVGIFFPYLDVDIQTPLGDFDENGIGDLELYGKLLGHTDMLDGGLGLEMSFPTGDEDEGLGADEFSFTPYLTGGVHLGPSELRGHLGYQVYTDDPQVPFFDDAWIYGGGLFLPLGEYVAARGELLGQSFDDSGADVLVAEPGIDFRLPSGEVDFLFRVNGVAGLNDESPDWGVGGSLVVAWNSIAR